MILFLLIPLCILLGVTVFHDRAYLWVSLCIAVLACVPVFISFEKGTANTQKMIVLSVMVALSVLGRFAFSALPHFKPVTAVVVLTGMYLGAESGFLCGALSAIVSNILFGQGPWTPFQMFTWGVIGLLAAGFSRWLKRNRVALSLYGVFSGILYSMMMDIWTVLAWDGTFSVARYFAAVLAAIPVTGIYVVSNVIFLLVLAKPIGEKLDRMIRKYGL